MKKYSVNSLSVKERLYLAKNSKDSKELEILAYDPIQNVCYHALKNPNCRTKRDFIEKDFAKCVTCNHFDGTINENCRVCKKPNTMPNDLK